VLEYSDDQALVLIANSTLQGDSFQRSVILVVEHEKDGAFGLVLNHFSSLNLDDLLDGFPFQAQDTPVMIGGPVGQNALFVLHDDDSVNDPGEKIAEGIYLGSDKKLLEKLIQDSTTNYIICYGYAGWGPGQLDEELKFNSWIKAKATKELVFNVEPHKMWRSALLNAGGLNAYFSQNVKDPFLN